MRAVSFPLLLAACVQAPDREAILPYDPLPYVDPLIGTGGIGFGVGSAYPGAAMPFGLARPSPDTRGMLGAQEVQHCGGYWYEDDRITGFSQIHLHGTGAADYGNLLLVPTPGWDPAFMEDETREFYFSHENERARPGFYSVTFDNGIRTEITATERGAVYRVTWPPGAEPVLVWDLEHALTPNGTAGGSFEADLARGVVDAMMWSLGALSGRHGGFPIFGHATFEPPFVSVGSWSEGVDREGTPRAEGLDVGGYVVFEPEAPEAPFTVEVRLGLSFTSAEQAMANHAAELGQRGFDAVLADAEAAWRDILGRVRVQGGSHEDLTIFYSALYHAFLMPDLMSDADGSYVGFDGTVHVEPGDAFYSDMSLWDTYRTLHPLLILAWPEWQAAFNRSLLRMAEQGGYLPRWPCNRGYTGCMIGEPAQIVLGESFLKGVPGWDAVAAFDAARVTADAPVPEGAPYGGRSGIENYLSQGFVASDEHGGAASLTLEYAWADHALGQWASFSGWGEHAARYAWRSYAWRETWDPETGFFRGRRSDGSFEDPLGFSETRWEDDYVEGDAWQYLWMVPYAPEDLATLMGGPEPFFERLDSFFERSLSEPDSPLSDVWYWHGNEPDIHAPYLYALLDEPARGSPWVRWVRRTRYGPGPDGLDGNDDGGTLSAWFVWSALGLFPVAGTDIYALGPPLFDRAEVDLPSGGRLVVARELEHGVPGLWESARLDGRALEGGRLRHAEISEGGTLLFLEGLPEVPLGGARWEAP